MKMGLTLILELRLGLPLTNDHVQQLLDLELTTILLHYYTYFHSNNHIVISDQGLVQDHGSPDHHQDHLLHPRQLVHGHQAEVPEAIIITNLITALPTGSENPITTQPTTGGLDIFSVFICLSFYSCLFIRSNIWSYQQSTNFGTEFTSATKQIMRNRIGKKLFGLGMST